MIGSKFKYPEPKNDRIFTLVKIDGYIYRFECGHWVTDSVFVDLVQVSLL